MGLCIDGMEMPKEGRITMKLAAQLWNRRTE
jgi:hypothetical protein